MNILGISGSPNESGNTAYAVQYALEILEKEGMNARYISLAKKEIHPCIGCWKCAKTRKCQFDDDMDEIIDGMRWCDGLTSCRRSPLLIRNEMENQEGMNATNS